MDDNRKLQEVELDLLCQFKHICEKHGFRYWAIGGTLIGAMRHQGFIPWDDDIDILMPAKDYFEFLSVANHELNYPYFCQSYLSEKDFGPKLTRLRNSETTGCTKWEYTAPISQEYNRGIFIDIIPAFYISENIKNSKRQGRILDLLDKAIHGYRCWQAKKQGRKTKIGRDYFIWLLCGKRNGFTKLNQKYIDYCYTQKNRTNIMGCLSHIRSPKLVWNTEWFDGTLVVPFENTTISVPSGYDEILTLQYGDWRTPVQGGAYHELCIVDTEESYKKVLNK